MEAVEHAAKIANLHEFVYELNLKYQTTIGERGEIVWRTATAHWNS